MRNLNFHSCFGLNIIDQTKREMAKFVATPPREKRAFGYINAHGFYLLFSSKPFKESLKFQDYTICDGHGACLVFWSKLGIWIPKKTPASWFNEYLQELSASKQKVLIWGHSPEELDLIRVRIREFFPNLNIVGCLDGFSTPNETALKTILELKPDTILIAQGMPRQELALQFLKENNVDAILFCIGATLLYKLKIKKEAPDWVRNFGGEWLWRWMASPIKMSKRYILGNSFVLWLSLYYFTKRIISR